MDPSNGLVRQAKRDAHRRMTMNRRVDIRPGFEDFRIDYRFAWNRADAGKLLQGKIEMHEPVFVALLGAAKHLDREAAIGGEATPDVTPEVADFPIENQDFSPPRAGQQR